jgi:hypothetical protein
MPLRAVTLSDRHPDECQHTQLTTTDAAVSKRPSAPTGTGTGTGIGTATGTARGAAHHVTECVKLLDPYRKR